MGKTKKLVIVGAGEFAGIAFEYFDLDSEYEVVAFAVEDKYIDKKEYYGLPVIKLSEVSNLFPPSDFEVFIAITYVKLNRARTRLYHECKELGYRCATYISSHSFVWKNVKIGENTFIFEDNTIQYYASIGNNTVLWSGNHIGHRSIIGDNCWLTSHDVVSGFCTIGNGSFIGVNASIGDNVTVADDIVLGAGAVTVKDLKIKGGVYIGSPAKIMTDRTAYSQFHVSRDEI